MYKICIDIHNANMYLQCAQHSMYALTERIAIYMLRTAALNKRFIFIRLKQRCWMVLFMWFPFQYRILLKVASGGSSYSFVVQGMRRRCSVAASCVCR